MKFFSLYECVYDSYDITVKFKSVLMSRNRCQPRIIGKKIRNVNQYK